MIAWRLFVNPVEMGANHIWLVLPLCAVLAVVYKTIRVERLRELPVAVLVLWAYMLGGILALAVGFYLLLEYAA